MCSAVRYRANCMMRYETTWYPDEIEDVLIGHVFTGLLAQFDSFIQACVLYPVARNRHRLRPRFHGDGLRH